MTGVNGKYGGVREGIGVIAFTLEGCHACDAFKKEMNAAGIEFKNINIDDHPKLGDMLEREYLTEYYPIVQIVNERKVPYYTFVTQSKLKNFKIVNYKSITELTKKLKDLLYEI